MGVPVDFETWDLCPPNTHSIRLEPSSKVYKGDQNVYFGAVGSSMSAWDGLLACLAQEVQNAPKMKPSVGLGT